VVEGDELWINHVFAPGREFEGATMDSSGQMDCVLYEVDCVRILQIIMCRDHRYNSHAILLGPRNAAQGADGKAT
jgi:hypothetical protein